MNEPLVNDLLELTREYQPTNETTFRARKISDSVILYSGIGGPFQEFVDAIFVYRKKNDPSTHREDSNSLFELLFSDKYRIMVNSRIQTLTSGKDDKKKIEEVDGALEITLHKDPNIIIAVKVYTSHSQSKYKLEDFLSPTILDKHLEMAEFMGFITFTTIHDHDKDKKIKKILHCSIVDRMILKENTTPKEKADVIIDAINEDIEFFREELKLNC